MSDLPRLPEWVGPASRDGLSRPDATGINRTQRESRERTITVTSLDSVVPVIYGEERVPGLLLVGPFVVGGNCLLAVLWGHGEIEGVKELYINGAAVPGSVTVTHYNGTMTQTPDPTLSAGLTGFADAYQGWAYSVLVVPPGAVDGFPGRMQIEGVVRGIKCADPRVSEPSAVSARYWRVFVTDSWAASGYSVNLAEIEMRASAGGADQTGSGTASASSIFSSSFSADEAFDKDPSTIWSTSDMSLPQWIAYDFGTDVHVAEVMMQAGDSSARASRMPRTFDIQYSDNGSDWTTATTRVDEPSWAISEVRTFDTDATTGGPQWTENPALHMYDWVRSTRYGPGLDIIGVDEVADRCDSLVEGAVRSRAGITLAQPLSLSQTMDIFSVYAECLHGWEGDKVRVVPDAPVDEPAAVLTQRDMIAGSLRLTGQDMTSAPTSVTVSYLQPTGTATQWDERTQRAALPGVDDGEILDIRSDISLPGIKRPAEAFRKANQRLRRLQYTGRYEWTAPDDGVRFQRGDVVALPDTRGLAGRTVRILDIVMQQRGRYAITAERYSPEMYPDDAPPAAGGLLPAGSVIPYTGSGTPAGWSNWTAANGLMLMGANGDAGTTGGADLIPAISGTTTTAGAHNGTATSLWVRAAFPGQQGSVDLGPTKQGMADQPTKLNGQGGHSHTYSRAATAHTPLYRRHRWITNAAAEAIPISGGVLAQGELITAALSAVTTYVGRMLGAASAGASGGTSSPRSLSVSLNATGAHQHYTGATRPVPNITFGVTFYDATAGEHDHAGSAVTVSIQPRRRRLAHFVATQISEVVPGCIVGYIGTDPLPTGWYECDGTNATVDLRDYFIEISAPAQAGSAAGNNTASWSNSTVTDGAHSHAGGVTRNYAESLADYIGHTATQPGHTHSMSGSVAYTPAHYKLRFIEYTGAA